MSGAPPGGNMTNICCIWTLPPVLVCVPSSGPSPGDTPPPLSPVPGHSYTHTQTETLSMCCVMCHYTGSAECVCAACPVWMLTLATHVLSVCLHVVLTHTHPHTHTHTHSVVHCSLSLGHGCPWFRVSLLQESRSGGQWFPGADDTTGSSWTLWVHLRLTCLPLFVLFLALVTCTGEHACVTSTQMLATGCREEEHTAYITRGCGSVGR